MIKILLTCQNRRWFFIVGHGGSVVRFVGFRPKGYGFEYRSSRHVVTLDKSLTHSLWRFRIKLRHSIHALFGAPLGRVTGQNGIGQNGTDKMVATFIDSNSTELNLYSLITSHK